LQNVNPATLALSGGGSQRKKSGEENQQQPMQARTASPEKPVPPPRSALKHPPVLPSAQQQQQTTSSTSLITEQHQRAVAFPSDMPPESEDSETKLKRQNTPHYTKGARVHEIDADTAQKRVCS
jgi:hypothetical protein